MTFDKKMIERLDELSDKTHQYLQDVALSDIPDTAEFNGGVLDAVENAILKNGLPFCYPAIITDFNDSVKPETRCDDPSLVNEKTGLLCCGYARCILHTPDDAQETLTKAP